MTLTLIFRFLQVKHPFDEYGAPPIFAVVVWSTSLRVYRGIFKVVTVFLRRKSMTDESSPVRPSVI